MHSRALLYPVERGKRQIEAELAVEVMAKYGKEEEEVISYLIETQCTWFLLELGHAHLLQKIRGQGLACLLQVADIFQEIQIDS
ncbi:MAG: hypothetical protein FJ333_07570 [Sphingomonadales bacterium]|nr:hypothetical protein [Sphingomonadales bacterium]